MRDLPRGTVTFLFTDIESSTQLLHELGDAYADVLSEHRRLLREAFSRHGGVEVDTQGDAFFYVFERAADAVAAAAEAQEALLNGPVRVRIGVHTGEPLLTDEGYVGVDVHRGARVMSAGHGGQVLVSETTRRLVNSRFELRDLGPQRLKDMTDAQHLFQLGDADFPPLKTLNQTNLPVAASALVGRETELEELCALLRNGTRVVTITGPGGSGKTRLALQAAAELVDAFADGVFWVPLASLKDGELVLPAISHTLGVRGDLVEEVRDKQLLLLLDNAEHLLGAAERIAELVAASMRLRLLVTSRAPLQVRAEVVYPLEPLTTTDAMTLFVERARANGVAIEIDASVEAICRRLDGLPLAIELAAARTKLLDPPTLLERLNQALPLLTGGARDAPERQRTLRGTIEWSYELLGVEARRLFARLSVFAGSFALDAAEAVCDAQLDALEELANLSLLKPTGRSRFLMLETIREYAAEQLSTSGEWHELRERHAANVIAWTERAKEGLKAADQERWLREFDEERGNVRAALEWLDETAQGDLLLELVANFWDIRGAWVEGLRWAESALARSEAGTSVGRATALANAGSYAAHAHDFEKAMVYGEQSLAMFRELGDVRGTVRASVALSTREAELGRLADAERRLREATALARSSGSDRMIALTLGNRADLALRFGDDDRAIELAQAALDIYTAIGWRPGIAWCLYQRAVGLFRTGRESEARVSASEGLSLADSLGDRETLVWFLVLVAAVAAAQSAGTAASTLLGSADVFAEQIGLTLTGAEADLRRDAVDRLRRQLGDGFDDAYGAGQSLLPADAVQLALAHLD